MRCINATVNTQPGPSNGTEIYEISVPLQQLSIIVENGQLVLRGRARDIASIVALYNVAHEHHEYVSRPFNYGISVPETSTEVDE